VSPVENLIDSNQGLVWKQLHKFNLVGNSDAQSIGLEALWKAAETYDEYKQYTFSTYATVCIYNALGSFIRATKANNKLEIVSYNVLSDNGEGGEYLDYLSSATDNVEEAYIINESIAELNKIMDIVTKNFGKKQQVIINYWREHSFTAPTGEIASVIGVSQSYVSSTISTFKNKLRAKIETEVPIYA